MKKKHNESVSDQASITSVTDLTAGGSSRPERSSGNSRKSASHSSSKRKRAKTASRKGNAAGGIHQRGDKRVLR